VRAFKRALRRQPDLRERVERTLKLLAEEPFHPRLHSHKLKGELAGAWACTVDYDTRILFEFVRNLESGEEEILLLTMGTHEEVY
jgi:mRNA-degrading endonuclease YafQ of YafQ-DinJ toxin-antitoxin module